MSTENLVNAKTISAINFLKKDNLIIPEYQRPYKWSTKNVNQLIDDIIFQSSLKVSEYRIGTVVIHKDDNNNLNIVDGQQRSLTLTLIAYCLINNGKLGDIDHRLKIEESDLDLLNKDFSSTFANDISKYNLINNFQAIENRLSEFDKGFVEFFLEKCTFVLVTLDDISEAFQFFDSQNARGKDLEPHDLLKAFHLREMNDASEEEKKEVVVNWEEVETDKLSDLFSLYLYRIRNWSKGYSARKFTKNEVDVFKGISPGNKNNYPFSRIFTTAHYYTDYYNNLFNRKIDRHHLDYPFQLDQVIVNGKRFFEMVSYYKQMMDDYNNKMEAYKNSFDAYEYFKKNLDEVDYKRLKEDNVPNNDKFKNKLIKHISIDNEEIKKIFSTLLSYDERGRTGDKYVRALYDCAILYFIDKFGFEEESSNFSKIAERMFYWAYKLRVEQFLVQIASIDNHAIGEKGSMPIFKKIRESIHPSDVLNLQIDNKIKKVAGNSPSLEKFFEELS